MERLRVSHPGSVLQGVMGAGCIAVKPWRGGVFALMLIPRAWHSSDRPTDWRIIVIQPLSREPSREQLRARTHM